MPAKKSESHNGDNVRYKVRLVAKGYAQREDIDYNKVFSPIVKYLSIQILLALATQYELELNQLGVKTAFLHGNLKEKIYCLSRQDSAETGFKTTEKEYIVYKLKIAL